MDASIVNATRSNSDEVVDMIETVFWTRVANHLPGPYSANYLKNLAFELSKTVLWTEASNIIVPSPNWLCPELIELCANWSHI